MTVKIQEGILHEGRYKGDAGYDIQITEEAKKKNPSNLMPGMTAVIKTGLRLRLPEPLYGVVLPRSSTSLQGIVMHPAIIDSGFEGEVVLICTNHGFRAFALGTQDRFAQIMFHIKPKVQFNAASGAKYCPGALASRGELGLGSTN